MARESPSIVESGGVLIVGAGLAGLFTALTLRRRVTVMAAARLGEGAASGWAQGGIAAALGADDSLWLHAADTIAAGAGLVPPLMAHTVVSEAAARIADLAALGVPFEKTGSGAFLLGLEAAHSCRRIVRAGGDRTGAEILTALVSAVRRSPRIRVAEELVAFQLACDDGRVVGVYAHPAADPSHLVLVRAEAIVFALGGISGLFAVTTNPAQACGQGVGMAARAGAAIADPEFVQFHPTAIDVGRDPAPLASETLRGEGAVLINDIGHRFMAGVHPDAELAPRDVVARAIFREIRSGRRVFLDARASTGMRFPMAFPTVFESCRSSGIDPRVDLIPLVPAAHYHMGGIWVDEHARTSMSGLWAVGECASTGFHGANRLASNSLLEAVVFGARAAKDVDATIFAPKRKSFPAPSHRAADGPDRLVRLRSTMTTQVGIERTSAGLRSAIEEITELGIGAGIHMKNMTAAAMLIATAALARQESRGGHYRSDFPQTSDQWRHRTIVKLEARAGNIAAQADGPTTITT